MVSFAPTNKDTFEDRRLYTEARLVDVTCERCHAVVQVKKNSEQHTSIQWHDDAVNACEEFKEMAETPQGRSIHASCSALRSSIEKAVAEGQVEIGAIDGY